MSLTLCAAVLQGRTAASSLDVNPCVNLAEWRLCGVCCCCLLYSYLLFSIFVVLVFLLLSLVFESWKLAGAGAMAPMTPLHEENRQVNLR